MCEVSERRSLEPREGGILLLNHARYRGTADSKAALGFLPKGGGKNLHKRHKGNGVIWTKTLGNGHKRSSDKKSYRREGFRATL